MKYSIIILLLFIAIPIVFADDILLTDDLYARDSLTLDVDIRYKIKVTPTTTVGYELSNLRAMLYYYPKEDYRQNILSIESSPQATIDNDAYLFTWNFFKTQPYYFGITSRIKTEMNAPIINKKITFPIRQIDGSYSDYLEETAIIDIDEDIRQQALMLAAGKDDLFDVVFSIGEWINSNIVYDLTTVTAEAALPASWVMENRKGVCDEITSLFIAMNRALGIPAKFVSGLTYTNAPEFTEPWGPHGWAEVYFPEVGWIPFDITFGLYGIIDAAHIKMRESNDAQQPSLRYESRGKNIDIEASDMEKEVTIKEKGEYSKTPIRVTSSTLSDKIGFESYNVVEAIIENLENTYQGFDVIFADTTHLHVLSQKKQPVLLKPKEKKTIWWVIRVDPLESGFYYDFPVVIYTTKQANTSTSFQVKETYNIIDKTTAEMRAHSLDVIQEKPLSSAFNFECFKETLNYYVGDELTITCDVKNNAGKDIDNLELCLYNQCEPLSIADDEYLSPRFTIPLEEPGSMSILMTLKNEEIEKTSLVLATIFDEPSLSIENIEYPLQLDYNEYSFITFTLHRNNQVPVEKIKLQITHSLIEHEWEIETLESDAKLELAIAGSNLDLKDNKFVLSAVYESERGEPYLVEETFFIELSNPTFSQKTMIALNKFGKWTKEFINNVFT